MRNIKLANPRLQALLSNLTEICYNKKLVEAASRARDRKDERIPDLHGASEEYLREALKKKLTDYGFPQSIRGLGMTGFPPQMAGLIEPVEKQVKKIGSFLGTPVNALTMIYPADGYIGWHHNGNAPGYNILMSYSLDGEGDFRYYDKKEDKVVIMPDSPGWFVKVGYYPGERAEKERIYWHAAQTKQQRVSVAWIMNHRQMWISMIEEITGGDYDKEFVLSQGNP